MRGNFFTNGSAQAMSNLAVYVKLDPSQENIDQFFNKLCDVFIETAKQIDVCKIKESPN